MPFVPTRVAQEVWDAYMGRWIIINCERVDMSSTEFIYRMSTDSEFLRQIVERLQMVLVFEPPPLAPGEISITEYLRNIATNMAEIEYKWDEDPEASASMQKDASNAFSQWDFYRKIHLAETAETKLEAFIVWQTQVNQIGWRFKRLTDWYEDPFWNQVIKIGNALYKIPEKVIEIGEEVGETVGDTIGAIGSILQNGPLLLAGGALFLGILLIKK